MLDDALIWCDIENVKLVDLRRDNQLRYRINLIRRWRLLDQFQHLIPEYNCHWRQGQILAYPECGLFHLRRHRVIMNQIFDGVLQSGHDARSAAFNRSFYGCGIAGQSVRRSQGLGH